MRKHTLKDIHTYTLKYYINMWVWIYSISTSTVWVHGVHIYWCMGESPKKTLPHCWMAKNMINDGELVSWFQNLFLSSLTLSMHPGVQSISTTYFTKYTFDCKETLGWNGTLYAESIHAFFIYKLRCDLANNQKSKGWLGCLLMKGTRYIASFWGSNLSYFLLYLLVLCDSIQQQFSYFF